MRPPRFCAWTPGLSQARGSREGARSHARSPGFAQAGEEAVACGEEEPLPEGLRPEEFVAIADYAATDETQVLRVRPRSVSPCSGGAGCVPGGHVPPGWQRAGVLPEDVGEPRRERWATTGPRWESWTESRMTTPRECGGLAWAQTHSCRLRRRRRLPCTMRLRLILPLVPPKRCPTGTSVRGHVPKLSAALTTRNSWDCCDLGPRGGAAATTAQVSLGCSPVCICSSSAF